ERRAKDPERERAKVRAWQAANQAKVKAARAKRVSHLRVVRREYRRKNRDRVNAYWRDRHAKHPELLAVRMQRRQARKMNAPGRGVTAAEWLAIVESFDHRCAYCLARAETIEMDHVIALARGGAHEPENVVPACTACNSSKKARPVIQCFDPSLVVGERMGNHFFDAA
ncbi:MAG TPA: HNH endonuclease, partial [Pseudolabrys sp.]|nr:HNH endonuclease [Pseudolabrys sp.]